MWGMEKASIQEKQQKNQEVEQNIKNFTQKIECFLVEVNQLILDKPQQTKLALTCLLAGGHVLLKTYQVWAKPRWPVHWRVWLDCIFSVFSLPMTCWQAM